MTVSVSAFQSIIVGNFVKVRHVNQRVQIESCGFTERENSPNIDTKTGDVFRVSASGNVIETVSTDPRLVPSHSVGMSADGSVLREMKETNFRKL